MCGNGKISKIHENRSHIGCQHNSGLVGNVLGSDQLIFLGRERCWPHHWNIIFHINLTCAISPPTFVQFWQLFLCIKYIYFLNSYYFWRNYLFCTIIFSQWNHDEIINFQNIPPPPKEYLWIAPLNKTAIFYSFQVLRQIEKTCIMFDVHVKNDEIPTNHFWGITCDGRTDRRDRIQYSPVGHGRE